MTRKTPKAKVVKNRFGIISVDVYLCKVFVSVNQTDTQFQNSLMKLARLPEQLAKEFIAVLDSKKGHNGQCSWSDEAGIYFIRLYDYQPIPFYYGVINHEVFHAAHHLLQGKGLELTDSSEEAYAYLVSHLTQKVHEIIK